LQDFCLLNGIFALITKITPILETLMNQIVLTFGQKAFYPVNEGFQVSPLTLQHTAESTAVHTTAFALSFCMLSC